MTSASSSFPVQWLNVCNRENGKCINEYNEAFCCVRRRRFININEKHIHWFHYMQSLFNNAKETTDNDKHIPDISTHNYILSAFNTPENRIGFTILSL